MTEIKETPMLDGLVEIIDEIRGIDVSGFYDYPNSIAESRLGTHADSEFNEIWGDINEVVLDEAREIRQRVMPNDEKYIPFGEPHFNLNALSSFDPSVPDDFVALMLQFGRNRIETAALHRLNLKVAYYVHGSLRIQATISPEKGIDVGLLNCTQEELTANMVEEARVEAIDLIAEHEDLNDHSQ